MQILASFYDLPFLPVFCSVGIALVYETNGISGAVSLLLHGHCISTKEFLLFYKTFWNSC